MKLALIIGLQQGNTVKPRLQGIKDNLTIDCFDTIPLFIDNALKRNSIYDRILVLSTKLDTKTINDLYSFWSATSKETEVIMLSKAGADENKARIFLDVFKTPVAAAMLVNSTTVQTIAEAVLRPTSEITHDYGIKDFLAVEVEEDTFIEESINIEKENQHIEENTQLNTSNDSKLNANQDLNNQPIKKEKRSLFNSLFGKKSKKVEVQSVNTNEQQEIDETVNDNSSVEQLQVENSNIDVNERNTDNLGSSIDSDYSNPSQQDFSEVQNSNYQNVNATDTVVNNEIPQSTSVNLGKKVSGVDISKPKKVDITKKEQRPLVDETFESTFVEVPTQTNDFEPEKKDVDLDFGADISQDYYESEVHYKLDDIKTADESFEDANIGAYDEQYRQQSEAPKVVTKTVVKEVVRNVNTGSKNNALNGVYSGRLKKVIVVTGDRGTGITSTALNIAKTLAQKVDVLYFDCDTKNHGLLNYIDYSNFKNYEQTHMNGVKLCKSSQAFDRCVISFDENFYLLTTDFSCDTTDEELRAASEVVAERAPDFGAVVVDCPVDKLYCITDLILTCQGVICVEGSKRGFMNMLCQFEGSVMPSRYKRTFSAKGTMLVTKCNRNLDLKRLVSYIKAIYEPGDINWLTTTPVAFNGKLTDELLNNILEG